MGFRFRRRVKLLPGVHLNVSRGGLSVSVGGRGGTLNIGKGGRLRATVGLPGTGLSYSKTLRQADRRDIRSAASRLLQGQTDFMLSRRTEFSDRQGPSFPSFGTEALGSAPIEALTSASMLDLQRLIQQTNAERKGLEDRAARLSEARQDAKRKVIYLSKWYVRPFRAKALERAKIAVAEADAALQAIKENIRAKVPVINWTLTDELRSRYRRLIEACNQRQYGHTIWHLTEKSRIDRVTSRAAHDTILGRKRSRVTHGRPACFPAHPQDEWQVVPCLDSDAGTEIYFFPTFLMLCRNERFAVIDPKDVSVLLREVQVAEYESVPQDGRIIDYVWRYSNKDGSRDERFSNNYQVPVVFYDCVELSSASGLDERFLFSGNTLTFGGPLGEFCDWFVWHDKRKRLEQAMTESDIDVGSKIEWKLREEEDAYYFVKSWRGDEFFGFALSKNKSTLWVSVSTQHIGLLLHGARLNVWVDDQPLPNYGLFDGTRFMKDYAMGFVTWFNNKESKAARGEIGRLLNGKQLVVTIVNGNDEETSAFFDLTGFAPLFIRVFPEASDTAMEPVPSSPAHD